MVVSVGDPLFSVGKTTQNRAIIVPARLSTGGFTLAAGEYLVTAIREDGVHRRVEGSRRSRPELCVGGSCVKNPAATLERIDAESFERRLIYKGRSGNIIRAEYRES